MPAYVLARVAVSNFEQYKKYGEASSAAVAKFGGKFVVRGGQTIALEGPVDARRMVIIEFPSLRHAQDWYQSAEYQAAKGLRAGAAVAEFLAVEGV
ncbi:MAG TPA: DUF1330 domain-containing protein [bacterium]|jgi:uncharacterized protein (DUF1330 family)|nr:DUF1330 domain-containing protein [bacterium]